MQNYDLTNINTVINGNPPLEDTSAEIMAELLMDDNHSTYRMFERIATKYVNNPELRDGIDFTLKELVGYNTAELAKKIVDYNLEHTSDLSEIDKTSEHDLAMIKQFEEIIYNSDRHFNSNSEIPDEHTLYIPLPKDLTTKFIFADENRTATEEDFNSTYLVITAFDDGNIDWEIVSYISGNTLDIPANNPNIIKSYIDGYVNDINPRYDKNLNNDLDLDELE